MGELVLLLERQRKRAGPINLRCDPGVPFTHRSERGWLTGFVVKCRLRALGGLDLPGY